MGKQGEHGISWTNRTWNPIRGCSRVSEGCRHCYAEGVAYRFGGPGQPYEGLVTIGADGARRRKWNGKIKFVEEHLLDPLKWKKPQRVFVNSMSDLFHENVTDEIRDRIFAVMALCPQHIFQVLTKRPGRMLKYFRDEDRQPAEAESLYSRVLAAAELPRVRRPALCGVPISNPRTFPLPNVWLGVSVENQAAADERIPLLLQTPAAVRFISAEPLLGPLNLSELPSASGIGRHLDALSNAGVDPGAVIPHKLDWVIAGGESGPGARPMHPDWVRSIRDQCSDAGTAFFFKQWGEWVSVSEAQGAGEHYHFADGATVRRVGKKLAGSFLDGRQWREFPEATCAAL